MTKILTPFKVGALVLVATGAFLAFFTFVQKGGFGGKESIRTWAYFSDATGLGPKSRVQIAGIPVGEVSRIELDGLRARVTLEIRRDVPLKVDARLTKRSQSILGDFLLDLYPGSPDAEPMPDGGEIRRVIDKGQVDEVFDRLNQITEDISHVTASLRNVLGGEQGSDSLETILQNLVKISASMDQTIGQAGEKLTTVLSNFESFSDDVRGMTAGQEQTVHEVVTNVKVITEDVRDVLRMAKRVMGAGEGELRDSVASLKVTLARLDQALRNMESVTAKVDRGEGTLGRLVNDKRMGDSLAQVVDDASDFVGRVTELQTEVSLRSELHLNQRGAKNYLQLRLIPKPDKYYFFEIVDDPRGVTTEETVQRLPPDASEREQQTVVTTRQQLKFTAQFAKRYYFLTLRFGITESTGGVGANLHFLDDALTLRMDLFEFSAQNKDYPRLKGFVNYSFLNHLFITAGVDDALNRTVYDTDLLSPGARSLGSRRLISGRDFFLGGGFYFTDDDLKALISVVPSP